MKTAVLYTRVSTDEQANGYSLGVQKEQLIKHCEKMDIEILKIYVEDYSAKNFDRPEYNDFMRFAKSNHKGIDYLLFVSWDRFSRNAPDAYEMIAKLKKWDIDSQAITQPIDFSIPQNKIMLAIYLILAEVDNDIHSQRVKSGIRGANKLGRWTGMAPIGYKNSRDEENKHIIIPTDQALQIAWSFREVAKGERTLNDVRTELYSKGVKVSRSQFSKMVRNPIYAGKICVKALNNEPERLVEGVHQAIISEELFNEMQIVVSRRSKKQKAIVTFRDREELPLRGFLNCSNCGKHLTGSASRSRNGSRHYYYHCQHCKKERWKADKVNTEMEKLFGAIPVSKEFEMLYSRIVDEEENGNSQQNAQKHSVLVKELNKQTERKQKLQETFLDGRLSPENYTELKVQLETKISKISDQIAELKEEKVSKVEKPINVLSNLMTWYRNSDVHSKKKLLNLIFPEKLVFKNDLLTVKGINPAIALIIYLKGFRKNQNENKYYEQMFLLAKTCKIQA